MDFFLSKLLPLFVYPAGLVCLLLILALIFWKHNRFVKICVWASLALILVGGNRWVSMSLVRSLEQQYLPQKEYAHADVAVILGGGTDAPQYPRSMVEVNGAGDRVIFGMDLYKKGVVDHLIVTGGTVAWQGTYATTPAEDMSSLLQSMGVPAHAIREEGDSLNTYQDAQYSAQMIREQGYRNVILVTSAIHMPRAVKLFEETGLEVIPAPVDYTISDQEWEDLKSPDWENIILNLFPTAANLKSTTSALKEYIGMVVNQITD